MNAEMLSLQLVTFVVTLSAALTVAVPVILEGFGTAIGHLVRVWLDR